MIEVERERKMAEHLYYVSLKYSKTGDVILNLMSRWEKMIDRSMEVLLKKALKEKKIIEIPIAPKARENATRKLYRNPMVTEVLDLYSMFRRLPQSDKLKEHEFRKNVALRIMDNGKEIEANMEKLKYWNELLNNFVKFVQTQKDKTKK